MGTIFPGSLIQPNKQLKHTRECPSILIIIYPERDPHSQVSLSANIQHLCVWSASFPCHFCYACTPITDIYLNHKSGYTHSIPAASPKVITDCTFLSSSVKPFHPVPSYRWYYLLFMQGSRDTLNFAVLTTRGCYSYLLHIAVTHSHCNPTVRFHLGILSTSSLLIILLGQEFLLSVVVSILILI